MTTRKINKKKTIIVIIIILFLFIASGVATLYHFYTLSETKKALEIPSGGTIQNEIVYLDIDSVIIYDNFEAASSSGMSTGKSLSDILPELIKSGKLYLYKDTTIGLHLDKSIKTQIYGSTVETEITIYQVGNYFLRS